MIDLETTSPLVARVQAFELIQRAEQYLFRTTYASSGSHIAGWSQWYADVQDAVHLFRVVEEHLRSDIARRIGAAIPNDQFGN